MVIVGVGLCLRLSRGRIPRWPSGITKPLLTGTLLVAINLGWGGVEGWVSDETECSGGWVDRDGGCHRDSWLYVYSLEQPAVEVTGLDPGYLQESVPVMLCESRGVPWARNRSGATGLLQLMPVHATRAARLGYSWGQMMEPGPNLAVAEGLWKEQGWRPWECRR